MGVDNNPSISFGRNKNWSLNQDQKGIDKVAFEVKVDEGAKEKDKKKLKAQNSFNKQMFNYFDKNKDGILDTGELQDIQNAMKKLANYKTKGDNTFDNNAEMQTLLNLINYDSKANGNVDRNNLYEFLNTLNNTDDSVVSAETSEDGVTTVVYKDGSTMDHRMVKQEDGSFKVSDSHLTTKNAETGEVTTTTYVGQKLVEIQEAKDGVTTTRAYNGKITKIVDSNTGRTTTFDYETTPPTATEKQGQNTTVYLLDKDGMPDTSRPLSVSKFNPQTQEYDVQAFTYSEDGQSVEVKENETVTTYGFNDVGSIDEEHPRQIATKDGDNTVITAFNYGEDNAVTRTKTVKDADGNVVSGPEEVDADGNPLDKTYSVKSGDTWYSIAQKQYGLTNNSDIIAAVHILKDQYAATSGVAGYKKNIGPQSVDNGNLKLPASITIGDRVISLGGEIAPEKPELEPGGG